MRIYLVGSMGSGKSTLAKKMALRLNMEFIDLDKMIEAKAGRSVNDIFAIEGEDKFRELEHDCLRETLLHDQAVIATGGGTPCYFENMEFINSNGISVYIKLNPGILTSRLMESKSPRPLLKQLSGKDEIKKRIEELLAEREHYYLQSRLIVEGENIKAETIIKMIQESEGIG